MIRLHSISFRSNPQNMFGVEMGWYDPEKKILRTKMAQWLVEGAKAFQERMKLVGGSFDVEMMCDFFRNRPQDKGGKDLVYVKVVESMGGLAVEWRKDLAPVMTVESRLSEADLASMIERNAKTAQDSSGVEGRNAAPGE